MLLDKLRIIKINPRETKRSNVLNMSTESFEQEFGVRCGDLFGTNRSKGGKRVRGTSAIGQTTIRWVTHPYDTK